MKEWYEYEEFEDYWYEYVPNSMRLYTLEKIHRRGMNLDHFKDFWQMQKDIVLKAREQLK